MPAALAEKSSRVGRIASLKLKDSGVLSPVSTMSGLATRKPRTAGVKWRLCSHRRLEPNWSGGNTTAEPRQRFFGLGLGGALPLEFSELQGVGETFPESGAGD